MSIDKFILQDLLWIITKPVGVSIYDFDFRQYFDCRTPYDPPNGIPGLCRVGAFSDYESLFSEYRDMGIEMVHTPEEHLRCTSPPIWYPLIEEYTPKSRWFSEIPSFEEIEAAFGLPVFVKESSRDSARFEAVKTSRMERDISDALGLADTGIAQIGPITEQGVAGNSDHSPVRGQNHQD